MSSGKDTSDKQRKINNIMALVSGQKTPDDIFPKCTMFIGYGTEDEPHFFEVNKKRVSKEVYDQTVSDAGYKSVRITYGKMGTDENETPI
jgi:hypothetical protein